MADIQRISAQQAHERIKANQALLVCAYEDEAKCRKFNLEGSIEPHLKICIERGFRHFANVIAEAVLKLHYLELGHKPSLFRPSRFIRFFDPHGCRWIRRQDFAFSASVNRSDITQTLGTPGAKTR